MSQRSRQRLATDAEKLYVAQQLWLRLNETILWVKHLFLGSVSKSVPADKGVPTTF